MTTNPEENYIADRKFEREDIPDNVNETIQKIENLTMKLRQQDEMAFINVGKATSRLRKNEEKNALRSNEWYAKNEYTPESLFRKEEPLTTLNRCLIEEIKSSNDKECYNLNVHSIESQSMKKNDITGTLLEDIAVSDSNTNKACVQNLKDTRSIIEDVEEGKTDERYIRHGSVNTSTDTLVPIERRKESVCQETKTNIKDIDVTDSFNIRGKLSTTVDKTNIGLFSPYVLLKQECKFSSRSDHFAGSTNANIINCSILPKVHGSCSSSCLRSNILSNPSSDVSVSPSSPSVNYFDIIKNNINNNNNNSNNRLLSQSCDNKDENDAKLDSEINAISVVAEPLAQRNMHVLSMNESLTILPEHRKMQVSVSGKCETISNNGSSLPTTPTGSTALLNLECASGELTGRGGFINDIKQRRRQVSSSYSNPNRSSVGICTKANDGNTAKHFSSPDTSSLPITPHSQSERPQINITCPDGLAHALSEQNLRLQQIVLEHKIREDRLIREIHDMRMALLKKICPNCNVAQTDTIGEHCSAPETNENASICSWEAVEDRSGISSSASSSIQQPSTISTLWVPDHAVKCCTICQVEFWIGRRRHHCRSCGQIFCADCSEFWAPLPNAKLFSPVRLCGPCYHAVTTRIQDIQGWI